MQLGPFGVQEQIGAGGMGTVHRGIHRLEGVVVAVKRVSITDPSRREAFDGEVRAVARLNHPGIVGVYDHGFTDGSGWLAMELADGGTLRDVPPQDEAAVRAIVLEILDALAHAHARGVIHRDLKPGNLLRFTGDTLRIKLADFGIARVGDTAIGGVIGTLRYMAPEQLDGDRGTSGPGTDLFALGCMVYEWLEGRPPHPDGSRAAPAPAIRAPHWWPWLRAMLRESIEARPRSAAHAAALLPDAAALFPALAPLAPFVSDDLTQTAPSTGQPASGSDATRPAVSVLPLPTDWRTTQPPPSIRHLHATGLRLYGLRPIPLIGREDVRDRLWQAATESATGARVAVLSGPAGVGKSHLARWLSERAAEQGRGVWHARHSAQGQAADGLSAMVDRGTGVAPTPPAERRARWTRWTYYRQLPESTLSTLAALTDPASHPRTFRSATQRYDALITILLADGPGAVVWLDDLQWGADALGLAARILARDVPLCVVATLRDDLTPEGLPRLDGAIILPIGPLPPSDRAPLIRSLLGTDDALRAMLEARTAGNPLFAVQLIADWVARGLLVPDRHGFRLTEAAEVPLPADLAGVWRDRMARILDPLSAEATDAIQLAAVLGLEVDADEWRDALRRRDLPRPTALLQALLTENLIRPTQRGWTFAHGMLQETLLGLIADPAPLHATCAAVLADRSGDGVRARQGRHLIAAGRHAEALSPLYEAAKVANYQVAYGAALALLDAHAVALDHAPDPREHARSRLLRIMIARQQGRTADARQQTTDLLADLDLDTPAWPMITAEALCMRCMLETQAGRAQSGYDDALAARQIAPEVATSYLYGALALISLREFEAADADAQAGLPHAEHDSMAYAELLRVQGQSRWRRGLYAEGEQSLRAALDAAIQGGDTVSELLVRTELGAVCQTQGHFDDALPHYEAAAALVEPDSIQWLIVMSNVLMVQAITELKPDTHARACHLHARFTEMGFPEQAAYARGIVWGTMGDPAEQDAELGTMQAGLAQYGVVDGDFVFLARRVAERRRVSGDAVGAALAESFAVAQLGLGAVVPEGVSS
ncbi:MAG: tetratricopeptide (TPR) repeat protein [Myxococcota bacterium]|jgi:tetratricopeptide (TPR) repeat protein